MAKVLLSDIDGTLVDSNALHAEAWRRAFEHFGIEVGMDEAWSQIGKGGDQLIPVFVPEADRERLEPEIKKFRKEVFHRDYMPRIVSFAKARELLARVKKSGRRIVLATSSDKGDLAVYKKIVGMEDLVDEEATSEDAQASKPAPDIFAAALKKAGWARRRRLRWGILLMMRRPRASWGFGWSGLRAGVGNGAICWRRGVWRFIRIRRICCRGSRGLCWGGE